MILCGSDLSPRPMDKDSTLAPMLLLDDSSDFEDVSSCHDHVSFSLLYRDERCDGVVQL